MRTHFGLIGTITHDVITFDSGRSIKGIGGILYQAAVLCGLREDVFLYTNLGEELAADVEEKIRSWSTLRRDGINRVPGPGNQVHLHYPERGERIETDAELLRREKRRISQAKSVATKKQKKEDQEKKLLQRLQKKYGVDSSIIE